MRSRVRADTAKLVRAYNARPRSSFVSLRLAKDATGQGAKVIVMTDTVVYRALSLGAGVQSSVLALLLSRADPRLIELDYPKPDVAVFADTGWEPSYVYAHLDWLEHQLDYPLVRVSAGDLRSNIKRGLTVSGHRFVDVPFFLVDDDGKKGMLRRQCTNHYKIKPIYRHIRQLAGGQPRRPFPLDTRVEMWLGIVNVQGL